MIAVLCTPGAGRFASGDAPSHKPLQLFLTNSTVTGNGGATFKFSGLSIISQWRRVLFCQVVVLRRMSRANFFSPITH